MRDKLGNNVYKGDVILFAGAYKQLYPAVVNEVNDTRLSAKFISASRRLPKGFKLPIGVPGYAARRNARRWHLGLRSKNFSAVDQFIVINQLPINNVSIYCPSYYTPSLRQEIPNCNELAIQLLNEEIQKQRTG